MQLGQPAVTRRELARRGMGQVPIMLWEPGQPVEIVPPPGADALMPNADVSIVAPGLEPEGAPVEVIAETPRVPPWLWVVAIGGLLWFTMRRPRF